MPDRRGGSVFMTQIRPLLYEKARLREVLLRSYLDQAGISWPEFQRAGEAAQWEIYNEQFPYIEAAKSQAPREALPVLEYLKRIDLDQLRGPWYPDPYQNPSVDYTEQDPGGVLSYTATRATASGLTRTVETYCYKDFTADHFDALATKSRIYIEDTSAAACLAGLGWSNTLDEYGDWGNNSIFVYTYDIAPSLRGRCVGGTSDLWAAATEALYRRLTERAAGNNTVTDKIYSDEYATLEDTLSWTGAGAGAFQYFYFISGAATGGAGQTFDGYIENIDLQEAAAAAMRGWNSK